jgi:hypothetical protein
MPTSAADWLARYRRWQRPAEIGFWAVVLLGEVVVNTIVSWLDLRRLAPGTPLWQPALWEASSTLVIAALIPALLAFDRRFPLRWETWRRVLRLHVLGSLVFCAVHVVGMVLLRKLAYAAVGERYEIGSWPGMFFYEYLKDVRSYGSILLTVWMYRFVLLRLQGEARVLDAPEPAPDAPPASAPALPERFLVRKLRREFLIAAADIDWLQAQGNYVGLHVNGHDYLVRSTLADFLQQLDPARFARVHRSWAVNLDRVAEIQPLDSGDARLKMKAGGAVPCSRRYRDALAPR